MEILFEATLDALTRAHRAMRSQQWQNKSMALLHAEDLIERGLQAAIELDTNCASARLLSATYDHMLSLLRFAGPANDTGAVTETMDLVRCIRAAWCGLNQESFSESTDCLD